MWFKRKKEAVKEVVVYEDDCEFDFEKMNAFSIERLRDQTIIGYTLDEKEGTVVREWFFGCSLERHKELVYEFNIVIKDKDNKWTIK